MKPPPLRLRWPVWNSTHTAPGCRVYGVSRIRPDDPASHRIIHESAASRDKGLVVVGLSRDEAFAHAAVLNRAAGGGPGAMGEPEGVGVYLEMAVALTKAAEPGSKA